MLNSLRKAAGSWAAKILFALLILSFGAWGIEDFLRPQASTAVATVGGKDITPNEFSQEFRRQLDRLRQRFGGSLNQELALQLGLGSQVLSSLVERRLLSLEAQDLGIRISDDVVRRRILDEVAFKDAAGSFDRDRFTQALRANGLTEQDLTSLLREDIGRGMVSEAVTAGVAVPKDLAEFLYRHHQQERVADLLFVPNPAAETVREPSEAEVAAYYETNKERFTAPEYRALTAVLLQPETVAAGIDVPEERVREAYESRSAEFRTPEKREVSQLLFADEAAARAAAEKLKGGTSFDDVAAGVTAAGAQRTDLGTVQKGDLFPEAVEDAVFALVEPGVTEPVQSPLGWHILRVAAIEPGATTPFETVRDRVRLDVARDLAVDEVVELGHRVEDDLAGGATLETIAQQLSLPIVIVPSTDRTGKDEAGKPVQGLPPVPAFLATAFETEQGQVSRLTETPDGGSFVVRIDRVTPRTPRPLDTVRAQVVAEWRVEQARVLAATEGEKLAARVRAGESLAAVAPQGVAPRTTAAFTRQTNKPAEHLPATLVAKLFDARVGEVAVEAMPDGFAIARLAEVKEVDPAAAAEQVAALREDLVRGMTTDLQAQYAAALQNRHGVTVNEDAVRRAL